MHPCIIFSISTLIFCALIRGSQPRAHFVQLERKKEGIPLTKSYIKKLTFCQCNVFFLFFLTNLFSIYCIKCQILYLTLFWHWRMKRIKNNELLWSLFSNRHKVARLKKEALHWLQLTCYVNGNQWNVFFS